MKLEILPEALSLLKKTKVSDPVIYEKLKSVIADITVHPESGMGEPVELEGKYKGIWQRKFSFNAAVYYTFDKERIVILNLDVADDAECDRPAGRVELGSFSEKEYASVLAQMSANRGKDSEPKVGIFWYNRARNELFGVVSHRVSDYTKSNASDGRITCSEMHEDVWKREFRKRKYHGEDMGPYVGAYQDKPRGRIFYNVEADTYEVAVGKWLEDYSQAYDLILKEFDLPKERTSAKYATHWDIGMSWR